MILNIYYHKKVGKGLSANVPKRFKKGITRWHQEPLLLVLTEAIGRFKHSGLQDNYSAQLQGLAAGPQQLPLLSSCLME